MPMKISQGLLIPVLSLWLIPFSSVHAQTLGEALDAPELDWSSAGIYAWTPTTDATHDGIDAAISHVDPYNESWIETSVTGPIAVSFW